MGATKQKKFKDLKALFINCTLKPSPQQSHTQGLMDMSIHIMKEEGVQVEAIRFVDYDVAFGIKPDMRKEGCEKDEWPTLYKKVLAADILVIGTPIWLGEKSSVATKLIERLYAMSSKQNSKGDNTFIMEKWVAASLPAMRME